MKEIKLGNRTVGEGHPCLVIAEAGVNHNNDVQRAKDLIIAAANAGADVIKFQTYKAETITTKSAPRYWDPALDRGVSGTQYDTFKNIDDLPLEAYYELKNCCQENNIIFCSTPFNLGDVDILKEIGMDFYKISSSDIIYPQLLERIAIIGKPIILSTGAASIGEIEEAVSLIYSTGNDQIILQHCILSYPCKDEDANLLKMQRLQQIFPDIPIGYSDHTLGIVIPVAAVAMGAKTIEKHYTIDKSLPDSPDHLLSVDPDELKELVLNIRRVEKCKGTFTSGYYEAESKAYLYARKSVVSKIDIPMGGTITVEMLTCKRPGTGIYPKLMNIVVGSKASINIPADTPITLEMIR